MTAHFTCRVGDNPIPIVECHAKASIGQDLVDPAFHRHELFFRQTSSLRTKKRPLTGVSRRGAIQHEMERSRKGGNQIPSQTTLGNFLLAHSLEITSSFEKRAGKYEEGPFLAAT
ncbi:hypothetical protein [Novosphingobium sediminicola]|uniref:Uncharacterized protein n=1 Tax=Novosphingobium sediminicola TaxID=563162 RepID=A0A7W6CL94_9SPHN|nr:hypothetical protein [Novosphingobium sediminicola]